MFKSFGEIIAVGFGQCRVRDKKTQRFCYFLFWLAVYYFSRSPVFESPGSGIGRAPSGHNCLETGDQAAFDHRVHELRCCHRLVCHFNAHKKLSGKVKLQKFVQNQRLIDPKQVRFVRLVPHHDLLGCITGSPPDSSLADWGHDLLHHSRLCHYH